LHYFDSRTESDPKPASSNLVSYAYHHWSRHPYVRGGYHCPTANTVHLHKDLVEPLEEKLFFAGEGTSTSYGTIQAAHATGIRTADEVLRANGIHEMKGKGRNDRKYKKSFNSKL